MGEKNRITVEKTETFSHEGERVSSTRIRECLTNDNFEEASELWAGLMLQWKVLLWSAIGRSLVFLLQTLAT